MQVVKLAADSLENELRNCPEGAAGLVHSQPEDMIAEMGPLPPADCTRVQYDAKVLVCAVLLLVCLLPFESAACMKLGN